MLQHSVRMLQHSEKSKRSSEKTYTGFFGRYTAFFSSNIGSEKRSLFSAGFYVQNNGINTAFF